MKIVILSDDFPPVSFGGAGIIASNLAKSLVKRGHTVSVITSTQTKEDVGEFLNEIDGITIYKIYSNYHERWRAYISLYNPKTVKQVDNILSKIKPDIVHAHNVHMHLSYASLKVARRYSRAVFITMHDVMSVHYGKAGAHIDKLGSVVIDSMNPFRQFIQYKLRYNPFRNIIIRYYLNNLDRIFTVSDSLKKILVSHGISNIEVVHNGIKISDWNIDENKLIDFRKKYGITNEKVIFFGGRLTAIKGGEVVLKVFEKIQQKINNSKLLVVGSRKGWGEIMLEKAKNIGIDKKIVFTGWISRDEIPYAYSISDLVLVLSQSFDSFPTNNLEAMASKKPVIGTVFGGTSEIVLDGITGYIVNPKDIDKISERTLDLLINTEKAKSFGLAGYKRVLEFFSEEMWVDRTLSCYASYLDKKYDRK